ARRLVAAMVSPPYFSEVGPRCGRPRTGRNAFAQNRRRFAVAQASPRGTGPGVKDFCLIAALGFLPRALRFGAAPQLFVSFGHFLIEKGMVSVQRKGLPRPFQNSRPIALRLGMPDQAEIGRQVSRIELNRPQEFAKRFLRSAARLVQKSEDVVVIG